MLYNYIMSNINAKNIISENITVTNLNVSYINGAPYTPNPCANSCTKGYYVACPDCDYQGPDVCDCGTPCDYVAPEVDPCDCFVPCNNGGGGGGRSITSGGLGGSGVVILSIPTAYYTGTTTGSPTMTTSLNLMIL